MWVIRAEIHKMLVKIANWENPDQTASLELEASDMGLHYLSGPFGLPTSVQNFRTFTGNDL